MFDADAHRHVWTVRLLYSATASSVLISRLKGKNSGRNSTRTYQSMQVFQGPRPRLGEKTFMLNPLSTILFPENKLFFSRSAIWYWLIFEQSLYNIYLLDKFWEKHKECSIVWGGLRVETHWRTTIWFVLAPSPCLEELLFSEDRAEPSKTQMIVV